jgi:hypothetical protein
MASNSQPDFEELDAPETDDSTDGWINLDAGDELTGEITAFRPRNGENGVVEIDGRPYALNYTQRQQLISSLVVGAKMGVKSLEETRTAEIDGKEVEYNPEEVRFGRGD